MIEADLKQRERERTGAEVVPEYVEGPGAVEVVVPQDVPVPEVEYDGPVKIEDKSMAPCEKDLLKFILEEGCTTLDFDRDSKYYVEGSSINVAEFIDGILAEDDAEFVNSSYRKTYEE